MNNTKHPTNAARHPRSLLKLVKNRRNKGSAKIRFSVSCKISMTSFNTQAPRGIQLLGRINPAFAQILTPDALAFVAKLQRAFGGRREECLQRRQDRQIALHHGETLDFLP